MPLIDENRTLVRFGLRALAASAKPGLRALLAVAAHRPADGRRARRRVPARAAAQRRRPALPRRRGARAAADRRAPSAPRAIADELDRANSERRDVERRIHGEAAAQLRAAGERAGYVLAGEDWHPGVVGIVASRLAEASGRPVVLLCIDGERRARLRTQRSRRRPARGPRATAPSCSAGTAATPAAAGLELDAGDVAALAAALRRRARTSAQAGDAGAPSSASTRSSTPARSGWRSPRNSPRSGPSARATRRCCCSSRTRCSPTCSRWAKGATCASRSAATAARAPAVAFGTTRLGVDEAQPAEATFTLEVNEWRGSSEARAGAAPRAGRAARKQRPRPREQGLPQPQRAPNLGAWP